MRRPIVSQPASAASIRPGSSSTGRAPTKPNAVVSPGAMPMPWNSTRPARASVRTLASLRPLPVPPMATTASAPSSFSAASSVVSPVTRDAALGVDRAGDERGGAAR